MKIIKDICYGSKNIERQVLDLYLPESDNFSVFIYFHGGGLVSGDKSRPIFMDYLLERNIAVACANYRLYPEAVYPEFIKDAAAAVAWTIKHIAEYGNAVNFFVGGSSAGGYLAEMLCFDKKYLALHEINSDDISGYIFDAGQPTTHFNILREKGMDIRKVVVDEAAPLYHITTNRNYSPMLILVADNDMENRYEQTILLQSTLKHFGNDMEKVQLTVMKNSCHGEYDTRVNSQGESVFGKIIYDFIKITEGK